jgi:vitamin B12 transporter
MAHISRRRARWAFGLVVFNALIGSARADDSTAVPDVIVTATRSALEAQHAGSAITVITADEIQKSGSTGLADVLRSVPGLNVSTAGGVGATTSVSLRGATPGQTLVLVDGIQIGDPTATDGSFDFGMYSVTDIERIEIVRGPQSALYGSDAMGGVINIITRKGAGKPRRSITVEAGSYGTLHTRGTISGGDDSVSYAFGIDLLHSDGFPRYGYRVPGPLYLANGVTPLPPLPADDPANKGGASGRITYRLSEAVELEFGGLALSDQLTFDNPYAFKPSDVFSPYNYSQSTFIQGYARAKIDPNGGAFVNTITAFGNYTSRDVWETEGCYNASYDAFNCKSSYRGGRYGAEYQGDLKFGGWGQLTIGARNETETAQTGQSPNPNDGSFIPISARQTTDSVFALQQFRIGDRIDLSLGGRIDAIEEGETFETWRATAAYRIDETGTKLRASVGTGAKAPTLYQRFSQYGDPTLAPEQSVGFDAGFDQSLWNGRLTASASVFGNRFTNLIDFAFVGCPANEPFGCYFNVDHAETKGVELELNAVLLPDVWRVKATYTGQVATDLTTNAPLLEIPRDEGSLSLIYTGVSNLELEGRVTFVGVRYDGAPVWETGTVALAPYAKLDAFANYKVGDNVTVFARIENLTNARYQEVTDYGVPGRSIYGGVKVEW